MYFDANYWMLLAFAKSADNCREYIRCFSCHTCGLALVRRQLIIVIIIIASVGFGFKCSNAVSGASPATGARQVTEVSFAVLHIRVAAVPNCGCKGTFDIP